MKKQVLLLVVLVILFAGCERNQDIDRSQSYKPRDVVELCYDGTVYLKFGSGSHAFGAVKMPLEKCKSN